MDVAGDCERSRTEKSKLEAPGRGGVGGIVDLGVLANDALSGVGGANLYSPDVLFGLKPGDLRGAGNVSKALRHEARVLPSAVFLSMSRIKLDIDGKDGL